MRAASRLVLSVVAIAVIAAVPAVRALEVTTARELRDDTIPFQIKLESIQAAMETAYNDLLAKHNALLSSIATCGAKGSPYAGLAAVGADADGCLDASVPVGTVALFKTATCPTGWTRDSWWDNRFPYGAASNIGGAGGASSVKLSAANLPKHTHQYSYARKRRTDIENDTEIDVVVDITYETRNTDNCDNCKNTSFSVLNPYRRTLFCRKL